MTLNGEPRPLGGRGSGAKASRQSDTFPSTKTQKLEQRTRPPRKAVRLQGEFVALLSGIQTEAGIPNRVVDDGVGLNDGHWSHIKTANSPSGRGGTWKTFQEIADWFERDLGKRITWTVIDVEDSAPSTLVQADVNHAARQVRHWRHRRFFAELGRKGGVKTAERHGHTLAQRRGQLGGQSTARRRREQATQANIVEGDQRRPARSHNGNPRRNGGGSEP
jgi:hypothetical protein